MARRGQLFLDDKMRAVLEHGGELSAGRRKERRPFSAKRPVHVVLRAERARGETSLRRREHARFIGESLRATARRWAVRVYELAINSNHLHIVVRAKDRRGFQNFLRAFAGKVAMKVSGARKGRALAGRFWSLLAYTRLAEWGKSFHALKRYVTQNRLEAAGVIPYVPRNRRAPSRPPP